MLRFAKSEGWVHKCPVIPYECVNSSTIINYKEAI